MPSERMPRVGEERRKKKNKLNMFGAVFSMIHDVIS